MIVAYSRPPNLGNLLSYLQLDKLPGPTVLPFLDYCSNLPGPVVAVALIGVIGHHLFVSVFCSSFLAGFPVFPRTLRIIFIKRSLV